MRKEIIETGRAVEAAIEAACQKLGCERSECEWEIIDLPKKGFLGLRNTPAKVRVFIEVPDEKPAPVVQPKKPAAENQPAHPAAAPAAAAQKPVPPPRKEQASKPQQPPLTPEQLSEKETLACDYLAGILKDMGLVAKLNTSREHGGVCINITGEGLGVIIGRRGETLDAIQYLVGLVANRVGGDYMRVTIDCGDYRMKRKDTLQALATKLAGQVLKTNTSRTLEPMNPFERRIIHATVSEIAGVSSTSVGEEPNRRVVITSPTARPDRARGGRPGSRDGRDSGRRPQSRDGERRPPRDGDRKFAPRGDSRGPRRDSPRPAPAPAPQGPPKQTPEAAVVSDSPLYGKIDLD